ncbi:MAG: PhnD/SsuA/transferrin family substrate-binding protein [Myxococcota bacterium]
MAIVTLIGFMPTSIAAGEKTIVFFDPDANHQAISRFTTRFSGYLQSRGLSLNLQAVQSREAFKEVLRQPTTQFALANPSYLGSSSNLAPIMVSTSDGSAFYRKVLVRLGDATGSLKGKTLAAALPLERVSSANRVLAQILPARLAPRQVLVIAVTKDIDALLALAFGQVDAALVTPASIALLGRINPQAKAKLSVVFQTDPQLRPPLYEVSGRAGVPARKKLVTALRDIFADAEGRQAMQVMGIDGWIDYAEVRLP